MAAPVQHTQIFNPAALPPIDRGFGKSAVRWALACAVAAVATHFFMQAAFFQSIPVVAAAYALPIAAGISIVSFTQAAIASMQYLSQARVEKGGSFIPVDDISNTNYPTRGRGDCSIIAFFRALLIAHPDATQNPQLRPIFERMYVENGVVNLDQGAIHLIREHLARAIQDPDSLNLPTSERALFLTFVANDLWEISTSYYSPFSRDERFQIESLYYGSLGLAPLSATDEGVAALTASLAPYLPRMAAAVSQGAIFGALSSTDGTSLGQSALYTLGVIFNAQIVLYSRYGASPQVPSVKNEALPVSSTSLERRSSTSSLDSTDSTDSSTPSEGSSFTTSSITGSETSALTSRGEGLTPPPSPRTANSEGSAASNLSLRGEYGLNGARYDRVLMEWSNTEGGDHYEPSNPLNPRLLTLGEKALETQRARHSLTDSTLSDDSSGSGGSDNTSTATTLSLHGSEGETPPSSPIETDFD